MADDARPALWVGHVTMEVTDPEAAHDFYVELGMRSVVRSIDMGITELRGGTHIIFQRGEPAPGDAPFDLQVDDIEGLHAEWRDAGLDVTEIEQGRVHKTFHLMGPDDQRAMVSDSHAIGPV